MSEERLGEHLASGPCPRPRRPRRLSHPRARRHSPGHQTRHTPRPAPGLAAPTGHDTRARAVLTPSASWQPSTRSTLSSSRKVTADATTNPEQGRSRLSGTQRLELHTLSGTQRLERHTLHLGVLGPLGQVPPAPTRRASTAVKIPDDSTRCADAIEPPCSAMTDFGSTASTHALQDHLGIAPPPFRDTFVSVFETRRSVLKTGRFEKRPPFSKRLRSTTGRSGASVPIEGPGW
eukprot:870483-Prymnesium_polylepis.1